MEAEKSLGEKMMEACRKLHEASPKTANPDWWENGSDAEPEIPAETRMKIDENVRIAREGN